MLNNLERWLCYRDVENKLDDDIEEAETMLNKEQIETEKAYDDCSVTLKKFDQDNCQFSKDVENLLNVYADAAKNVIIASFITNFSSIFF